MYARDRLMCIQALLPSLPVRLQGQCCLISKATEGMSTQTQTTMTPDVLGF